MLIVMVVYSLLLKYHSLETGFSATVEQKILKDTYSTPPTLCGMERAVVCLMDVVTSTSNHSVVQNLINILH